VQELDGTIGEVLDTLDELTLRDNTLVIVTSDNGGMLNGGGKTAWQAGHRLNGDLLGFKFGAWEGGHRIPFIARWPGHIPPGSTSTQMICSVDMLATFAAIVNHPLKQGDGPDSVNVLPAFVGDPPQPLRTQVILTPNRPATPQTDLEGYVVFPACTSRSDCNFLRGVTNANDRGGGGGLLSSCEPTRYDVFRSLGSDHGVAETEAIWAVSGRSRTAGNEEWQVYRA
jgi:hypothetical protein